MSRCLFFDIDKNIIVFGITFSMSLVVYDFAATLSSI